MGVCQLTTVLFSWYSLFAHALDENSFIYSDVEKNIDISGKSPIVRLARNVHNLFDITNKIIFIQRIHQE